MTLTATRGVGLGVLGELAAGRREDLASELDGRTQHDLTRAAMGAPPARDATRPLLRPGLHLIAEIKRRSPSAGALAGTDEDLVTRARAYERGGAAAVSVLVEPRRFGGSLEDLRLVCDATRLPVLAKDFVVDRRQLALLRAAGADLVLLLAALHSSTALSALVREARELGLEPLVEAHDRRELERALRTDARIIGINNRDLGNLQVDPENAARLRALVPDDRLVVAESGIRSADAVRPLRALGFDGVLVGEALMRARCDPSTLAAEAARYVAAGRQPDETADPAAADRRATVKICGVTTRAGMLAAVRAGADAVGLNLVPTSRRCVTEAEARELIVAAREASGRPPRMVGILADAPLDEARRLVRTLELDAVQLCGSEGSGYGADIPCSVLKVLRLPAASSAEGSPTPEAVLRVADAISRGPVWAELVLDVAGSAGGSGQRVDAGLARAVASRVPVHLAGGLTAANVAAVLREIPAVGVDVATGVEREGGQAAGSRPDKDPFLVELFVKRAHAARLDLPAMPARASAVPGSLLEADPTGRWGVDRAFGGRYVPETLYGALAELEEMYRAVRDDPCFWSELRDLGRHFVGRPSALYRADRLAAALTTAAGRAPDAVRLFLKREDLNHTGAHKINNAMGQVLLALRLGKRRVIAETGAGQHGVATASACALLGLPCVVYMGAADVERQAANVVRMRALGAEVRSVTDGSATLKDAINEAMRDWVTNVRETHYVLGSAVGPHPYPTIVRDLQRVIGDEAAAQCRTIEGRLPDLVIACVGGGSNALGLFSRFIGEPAVRLVAVEAGGEGLDSARHAAALAAGSVGVLHGARSFLLQDPDGQVLEPHSISAGLDYPGVGPQLSALHAAGRLEIRTSTDDEAIAAFEVLARTEGILPALEPAHAIAALGRLLAENAAAYLPDGSIVLLGLSGRGDKDLGLVTPVGAMEVVA